VEAMTMADKIVVLRAGLVEQVGTPVSLYEKPCNTFVAGFIGSPRMNFMPAALVRACPALAAWVPPEAQQVGIRPEHWLACGPGEGLSMTVRHAEYMGAQRLVHAELQDQTRVELLVDGEHALSAGQTIHMRVAEHHLHVFDAQDQRIERAAA